MYQLRESRRVVVLRSLRAEEGFDLEKAIMEKAIRPTPSRVGG